MRFAPYENTSKLGACNGARHLTDNLVVRTASRPAASVS